MDDVSDHCRLSPPHVADLWCNHTEIGIAGAVDVAWRWVGRALCDARPGHATVGRAIEHVGAVCCPAAPFVHTRQDDGAAAVDITRQLDVTNEGAGYADGGGPGGAAIGGECWAQSAT